MQAGFFLNLPESIERGHETMDGMTRRTMIKGAGAALAAGPLGHATAGGFSGQATQSAVGAATALHLKFAVKSAMVQGGESWTEKFEMLQRLGYDGIDVDNTNRVPVEEFARPKVHGKHTERAERHGRE